MSTYKDSLVNRLEGLLKDVSEELVATADPSVNACGSCYTCCTARGVNFHKVTELEYELLAQRISLESAAHFRQYIDRQLNPDGSFIYDTCPNYAGGCSVYEFRPYSCRVFGHIREEKTLLPKDCVFIGHEKITRKIDYYEAIPGAARLRSLWREFQLLMALPPFHGTTSNPRIPEIEGPLYINRNDPLDTILEHIALQRIEEALQELRALDPADESPACTELWGLALAATGQHEAALKKYRRLLEQVPPRADFLYHAGCAAFLSGDAGAAENYWKHSCQLTPLYSPSLGMLGYLAHLLKDWGGCVHYFSVALQEDEANPFFHLRLAEALLETNRPDQARPHLESASLHPATRETAQPLLSQCLAGS